MGSAACYFLASRGQKVLGLEQFDTPHEKGSHAGYSRIIRKAYFEHPDYVPLLQRAYELWHTFGKESGVELYHPTGIVYFGRPKNENIRGIRTAAGQHGIPIKSLSPKERMKRFPDFQVPDDFDTIFEADAGYVTPENTIRAYVREAEKLGADIRRNMPVTGWRKEGSAIRVVTGDGEFTCEKLVITCGAWTSAILPRFNIRLEVTRQLLAWVSPPDPQTFAEANFPCWFVEDPALGTFYGFPIISNSEGPVGMKLAHHFHGVASRPEDIDKKIPGDEEAKLRRFLKTYLPAAGENIIHTKQCLYTYSPDTHFIIDKLPGYNGDVVIACGFSGHGFKFVPVVGEVMADLVMEGRTELPVGFLGLGRF